MKKTILMSLALILGLTLVSYGQAINSKAPDFTLPDLDGKNVKLSGVLGKGPVFISFWATWCGPCKKEIPELINVYNKYRGKGLEVLAISVDKSGQGAVKPFVQAQKIPYRILLDQNSEVFSRKFRGMGVPYGFLLDKDGIIKKTYYGYNQGFEESLSKEVEKLLPINNKSDDKESEDVSK